MVPDATIKVECGVNGCKVLIQWRSQKYCLGEASEHISEQGVWGVQPPSC